MISLDHVIKKGDFYKRTNTATLFKDNDELYKIIERNCQLYNLMISNIVDNYLIHSKINPQIVLPNELVIDSHDNVRGYRCKYVSGFDLTKLAKNLPIKEKIRLLNNLTSLLKEINNYLIVGDVNLGNCMYDKDLNGYLIDFDLATPINNNPPKSSLYSFINKQTNKPIESNLNTDKLKMAIICASILYDTNFESCFVLSKPYNKWNKFYQHTDNYIFKDYFKSSFKALNHGQIISEYLFLPDNNSFISLIEKDVQRIRKMN